MKTCTECQKIKELSDFPVRLDRPISVYSKCKTCVSIYQKKYRKRIGRKYFSRYEKKYREEKKKFIRSHKNRPCTDCNIKYPYYTMELDHISGKKDPTFASMDSWGWDRIYKELEKVEVVCANCHRERTHGEI